MIGKNSIVLGIVIPNKAMPSKPFAISVHANKNHGICDVVLVTRVVTKTNGKKTVSYVPVRRVTEVLSEFQGRQYDDPYVHEHLKNVLYELFNNAPAV